MIGCPMEIRDLKEKFFVSNPQKALHYAMDIRPKKFFRLFSMHRGLDVQLGSLILGKIIHFHLKIPQILAPNSGYPIFFDFSIFSVSYFLLF